jgi:hemoglobin/transferrin/lactoferrin receptor protein
MKHFILTAFAVLIIFYGHAQTIEDTLIFKEVDIVTTKFNSPKEKVPNKVETLTKEYIRLQNDQTTADLLQNSGNVFVQKSQSGGGSPIIRGFEANKVLIVVDGVRMNNSIFRGGHLQNVIRLDNSQLERADIVFGPGSLIYGSDAFGGVMHFQTLKPRLSLDKKTSVNGSGLVRFSTVNEEKTGHFDINIGSKKIASLTSATFTDYGDLRQGASNNFLSDDSLFSIWDRKDCVKRFGNKDSVVKNNNTSTQTSTKFYQYNIMQKFLISNLKGMDHTLSFYFTNSSNVNRYDRLTERASGNPRFAEWYYGPEMWAMASYNFRLSKPTIAYDEFSVTAAYQYFIESRVSRRLNNLFRRSQDEKVQVVTLNADAYKKAGNHRIQYGLEVTYNNVNSTAIERNIVADTTRPTASRYPDGGSNTTQFSLYLTDQWEVKKWLIISGGARFNYNYLNAKFNDKSFFPFPYDAAKQSAAAGAGSLGLVFLPGWGSKISILGTTGYRIPNVDDMSKVFESITNSLIVPNPNLKPEYTYNAELTYRKDNKFFYLEATGYFTWLTNALTLERTTFNGADSVLYSGVLSAVSTTVNKDNAYIAGFQGSLAISPWKFMSIYANIGYTYGRIKTDTTDIPLDHIAPLYGRFGIKLNHKTVSADIYSIFNGAKEIKDYRLATEDNEQYATPIGMPAWMTFNAKLSVNIIKQLSIQGGIENIFDTRYRTFASGVSAPGRNFFIALRSTF